VVGGAREEEEAAAVVEVVAVVEQKVDRPVLQRPRLKVVRHLAVGSSHPPGALDSSSNNNKHDNSNNLGSSSHACKWVFSHCS